MPMYNATKEVMKKAIEKCGVEVIDIMLGSMADYALFKNEFLDECLKTIGTGLGYPALMNDDVNIAALKKYGYKEDDIYNYSMVGCIENFITGMQPPWSDGRFDTPRYFDYLFNGGISETNNSIGVDTGDIENIKSMQGFMTVFEKQLAYGVAEYVAAFHRRNNSINQAYYPEPFLSCFCYVGIGRGLDINNGGSKYPSVHGAAVMGIGTTADSLAAIEKVVFWGLQGFIKNFLNLCKNEKIIICNTCVCSSYEYLYSACLCRHCKERCCL